MRFFIGAAIIFFAFAIMATFADRGM